MIKIILAEDHVILRHGIAALLQNDDEIEVVGQASNGNEVVKLLNIIEPDVVIADMNMPEMDGIAITKYIAENHPEIKVLVLSMLEHEKYVISAFEAGAMGYILKTTDKEELINAIKMVHKGEPYISHKISVKMVLKMKNVGEVDSLINVDLSNREMQILNLIAEGMTNMEIADKTFTSKRTVETHRRNLIEKTGTKNTASLIKFALLNGIIK